MIQTGVSYVPVSDRHRDDPYGEYDPKLGRYRRLSDDFFDHRKLVLKRITPVSLQLGPVPGGYGMYGYRCCYLTFSDGSCFSTASWMYPESKKSIACMEKTFNIRRGENRAADISKADPSL